MMKAHCDNCDALLIPSDLKRQKLRTRVTVNPGGFQCFVSVTVDKELASSWAAQDLCGECLAAAVQEWLNAQNLSRYDVRQAVDA